MKQFTYYFVSTHPDRACDSVSFIVFAMSRGTADAYFSAEKVDNVHLLKVTEEEIPFNHGGLQC